MDIPERGAEGVLVCCGVIRLATNGRGDDHGEERARIRSAMRLAFPIWPGMLCFASQEVGREMKKLLTRFGCLSALVTMGWTLAALPVAAQKPDSAAAQATPTQADQTEELAKQLANPVASLVSVPFQSNWEFGVGPDEDTRYTLNFQPVMPFSLNERWNLIARVIVPFLSQPSLIPGAAPTAGVSDIVSSFFFSPAVPKRAIWGLGPVVLLPTTSDPFLGTEKWGVGPTGLLLKQEGPWTVGALVNQIWSFAGDDDRPDVSQALFQPFVAYAWRTGYTFTVNTEATANWEAPSGEEWTVPINFQLTKIVKIGKKPLSVGGGFGIFVESPEGGPDWKLRTIVVLLFPK